MTASAPATTQASARQSRVGKRPIPIPKGVSVNLSGNRIEVQGPKGKLARELPPQVALKREGDVLTVLSDAPGRHAPRLQGLARALVAGMVQGAAQGYTRTLELVGTGYRAEVIGGVVNMQVGLSHTAVYQLPAGVSAEVPKDSKGQQIVLTSANKEAVGQAAATIRSLRPPEPYGGKGIRMRGEVLRRKAGKAGKKAG